MVQLLLTLALIAAAYNLFFFAFYILGAEFYDTWQVIRESKASTAKRRAYMPKVAVIVPGYNEQYAIADTIHSVMKNTYPNFTVFVVDDGSKDRTSFVAADAAKQYGDRVKVYWKKNGGKASAINHALHRIKRHELVMTLDADSELAPEAIANSVKYFTDKHVQAVASNVKVTHANSVLGLLQKLEYMIAYRSKKAYTVTNSEFIVGGVGAMYRYNTLRKLGFMDEHLQTEDIATSLKILTLGNKKNKVIYGADVIAYTEGVSNLKDLYKQRLRWKLGALQALAQYKGLFFKGGKKHGKMLGWMRLPLALLSEALVLVEPLMLALYLYFTFKSGSFAFFAGAYATLMVYMFLAIGLDDTTSREDKVRLLSIAPVAYFLFYIMNFIQFFSVLSCLRRLDKIYYGLDTKGSWKSPKRAMRTA
jgi:cellulose synthase/poly-beta-1,6-N-acetylglucosamine synthase-like glycosyltransferase